MTTSAATERRSRRTSVSSSSSSHSSSSSSTWPFPPELPLPFAIDERGTARHGSSAPERAPAPTATGTGGRPPPRPVSASSARRLVVVGRRHPEPAVHDLAAERGRDDQRRERDELRDQQLAVVGVAQGVEAAHLAPRLEAAGDHQRDDRTQRERGVAPDPLRAAPPDRCARARRRRAGRARPASRPSPARGSRRPGWRARCTIAGAGVARQAGREREADRQEARRRQPPLRQRVLRRRVAGQQDAEQRVRERRAARVAPARRGRTGCRGRRRRSTGRRSW